MSHERAGGGGGGGNTGFGAGFDAGTTEEERHAGQQLRTGTRVCSTLTLSYHLIKETIVITLDPQHELNWKKLGGNSFGMEALEVPSQGTVRHAAYEDS